VFVRRGRRQPDGQSFSISCGYSHYGRAGNASMRSARERIAALDRAVVEATAQPADAVC
jgi:hypothetical protein